MLRYCSILFCIFLAATPGHSSTNNRKDATEYSIGVTQAPPYVIIDGNQISGAAVFLWKEVADSLGLQYRFTIYNSMDSLFGDMAAGKVDIILTPRTITRGRLKNITMSVPFLTSKVGAVVKEGREFPIIRVFRNMVTKATLKIYAMAFLFIFVFAFLMWLVERKKNPGMFHPSPRGIFDGIWWAIITMATVGYGDTVPKTRLGKVITIVWMCYAIGLLFLITSEVASELTVAKLELRSVGIRELKGMKTLTIGSTGYSDALTINNVRHAKVNTVVQGIEEVYFGKFDAFIFDRAILQYVLDQKNQDHSLVILPTDMNEQYLCFSANEKMSGLMDLVNPVILQATQTLRWKETLVYYNIPQ